ncbi:hypothetical protein BY996DRAFT_6580935 [Phakopsora pachyrhizi]|nr:hypothetical protein BY996DRAFT_6580935 [Phakopsora pachyrhizi]
MDMVKEFIRDWNSDWRLSDLQLESNKKRQSMQVTTDTKNTQKRVGTGWDGRRKEQLTVGTITTDTGNTQSGKPAGSGRVGTKELGQKVDNHRADGARKRAVVSSRQLQGRQKANIDASASQRRMEIGQRIRKLWEGKKAGGRPREDIKGGMEKGLGGGKDSLGSEKRYVGNYVSAARKSGKGKYWGRRRTDIRYISKAVVERWSNRTVVVEVGRRARRRHTVVRPSYHFSAGTKELGSRTTVDNHRADGARKRAIIAGRQKADWSTDKEAVGREKIVGRRVGGEVSVGLVRQWDRRRTDIRYISKVVVERRSDRTVGPVGLWHWVVKVGRRAMQRHTVVRSSYHFRVGTKFLRLLEPVELSRFWITTSRASK